MLVMAFFQWWYGPGWRDAASRLRDSMRNTYLGFSVPILIRTMFSPWKRIITYPGGSLEEKAKALLDNLVSRAVGFVVRCLALIAATILLIGYAVIGGITLLLWPLIPPLIPALLVAGLL